ncbi:DUF397 domain-containing protein [Actinoplanes sp. L3-i22]|uniref:DUF397 domain-containing protein n=1 Tax=Actinoplanes sp. L3-i22 TaxID=2836373 RepID=UPI001C761D7E|nr:DUF397 domain-containing protein [Actinoplanes sp. L3-i22]BCY09267.1 transcriptional regulator [Actinoplanes sp. L3-i22]
MTNHDLSGAVWHKSTRSGGGQNCVEVADNLPQVVAVRDTKNRDAGPLLFTRGEWTAFLTGVKSGEFDLPA